MSRRYITETIWHDPEVKNYIMLDVTSHIPQQSEQVVDGVRLFPKSEYHCTLLAANKLSDNPETSSQITEDAIEYISSNPDAIRFTAVTERYYICRDDEEVTLIVEADVVGLEGLRAVVRRTIPSYGAVFPHVTLMKNQASEYGIGIHSAGDLESLCYSIDSATIK